MNNLSVLEREQLIDEEMESELTEERMKALNDYIKGLTKEQYQEELKRMAQAIIKGGL